MLFCKLGGFFCLFVVVGGCLAQLLLGFGFLVGFYCLVYLLCVYWLCWLPQADVQSQRAVFAFGGLDGGSGQLIAKTTQTSPNSPLDNATASVRLSNRKLYNCFSQVYLVSFLPLVYRG